MASKKKDDLTFSIKVKAPKEFTEIVTDKKSGKKSGLLNACANALAEGIEKSNLKEQVRQAAGKAISAELKEKGKEAEKRLEALRASKPKNNKNLVFTKHIEWDEHHKSGPVSANIDTGAMKQKKGEKTRVNTAAKLFYEIVSKTPVDEDYDYTRPAKNNVYGKKFFKLEKNKNGKKRIFVTNDPAERYNSERGVLVFSPSLQKKDYEKQNCPFSAPGRHPGRLFPLG